MDGRSATAALDEGPRLLPASKELTLEELGLEGPLSAHVLGPLSEDDLLEILLREAVAVAGERNPFPLRVRHHEIARLMVMGHTQRDVAKIVGYTESTISILKQTPSFQNLLLHYSQMRDAIVKDPVAKMYHYAMENLDKLQTRIDTEEVPFPQVQRHTMNMLDRIGHGPIARTHARHEHILLSDEDIADVKKVIEGEALPADSEGGQSPGGGTASQG